MLVVAPDLVIRFANGAVCLHTLKSLNALWFPNPSFMVLLSQFARPADENAVMAKFPAGERQTVEAVLASLKEIHALRPAVSAGAFQPHGEEEQPIDEEPRELVRSALAPLSETIFRLAATFAALSPEAGQKFDAETGQGLRDRLEALIAGASALEAELDRFAPGYVDDQLRGLGIDKTSRNLRLHIGAGSDRLPGWVNIDGYGAEFALDIKWGLPFGDGAADYVFMSHVLEHRFYPDDALDALNEVRRVLAPGGRVRIIVPDIEKCLRAYVDEEESFFAGRKAHWPGWTHDHTRLEHFLAYAGAGPRPSYFLDSHKYGYDFETMTYLLTEAGFTNVERSDYMDSADPVLRIDEVSRIAGARYDGKTYSLFVEATVP